jgi:hypothetical protein
VKEGAARVGVDVEGELVDDQVIDERRQVDVRRVVADGRGVKTVVERLDVLGEPGRLRLVQRIWIDDPRSRQHVPVASAPPAPPRPSPPGSGADPVHVSRGGSDAA